MAGFRVTSRGITEDRGSERPAATVDPRTFGCAFDGVTDDRPGFAACVAAAVATITATGKGAVIQMPAGVASFGSGVIPPAVASDPAYSASGVPIPVNLPGRLVIRGMAKAATTIQLSTACHNAFWIQKTADYDTFRNVTFEDFTVDNNNTTGRCHLVIGNMPSAATPQLRLNYADLYVRRVDTINVPVDLSGSTTSKTPVLFLGTHLTALEATQTSSQRVYVEDMTMSGGANGVAVTSWGAGSLVGGTNHYYNDVYIRRCTITRPAVATTNASQTDFYVCGSGFGDYFEIIDCAGTNSGDDSIEVGAMQRGLIENFTATDAFLVSILFRNSHALTNVTEQRIVVRNFTHRIVNASAGTGTIRPLSWIGDNSLTFGTFEFEGVDLEADGITTTRQGSSTIGQLFDSTPVERRTFRGLKVRITNYVFDETSGAFDMAVIDNQSTSGTITIRDLDTIVTWAAAGGAGAVGNLWGLCNRGSTNVMDVDGYLYDGSASRWTNSTGGSHAAFAVARPGGGNGLTTRTSARGLVPKGNYGPTGVGFRPVAIGSSAVISSLRLSESDFSLATNITADVLYSGSTNDAKVFWGPNVIANAGAVFAGRRALAAAGTLLQHDGIVGYTSTASAFTLTLTTGANTPPGHIYEVVDESNAAGTNNITIARASTDTFTDGTTSKAISANGGTLKFYWTGSKWAVA